MEKRDLRERYYRARLLELQQRHPHSGGWGQRKEKRAGSKLTGSSSGLTGVQTGLTGASSKSENFSTAEVRTRLSFKKLLAKYEKEGAAQK